jgi:RNA polymerase sigma factor (sigma-70 family)
MTDFDGTSDNRELLDDPTFKAQLDQACKSAFKKYDSPSFDSWQELENAVVLKLLTSRVFFLRWREVTNAKGYLYQIARNVLVSTYLSDHHDRTATAVEEIEGGDGDRGAEKNKIERRILLKELKALLNEILPLLTTVEREAFEWYLNDKSFADMARDQNVVRATPAKRCANAIKKIRRYMRTR